VATVLDVINAFQAAVTTAKANVEAAQAAESQLSADLQSGGPALVENDDGSFTLYQWSGEAPGYTVLPVRLASMIDSTTGAQ
jgi:hypothetical protein